MNLSISCASSSRRILVAQYVCVTVTFVDIVVLKCHRDEALYYVGILNELIISGSLCFLPREAMLARSRVFVCPSVCHKSMFY